MPTTYTHNGQVVIRNPEAQAEIPKAYAYVCANDKFFGDTAIFLCNSEDLSIVVTNCENREDYKYVRVCYSKPRLRPGKRYTVMCKESASRHYRNGGW